MKISKLIASLFLLFFVMSCTDDQTDVIIEEEGISGSLSLSKIEELEQKELLYRSMRDKIDVDLSIDFSSLTELSNVERKSNEPIDIESLVSELKKFHSERLLKIYSMRESTNFTSIQSIVDEINSLKLISPEDSKDLFNKYSASLINRNGIVSVAQNIAHPNITNADGILKFDGININLSETKDKKTIPIPVDDDSGDDDYFPIDPIDPIDPIEPVEPVTTSYYIFDTPYKTRTHISQEVRKVYETTTGSSTTSIEYIIRWGAGVKRSNYILWNRSTPYTYYESYVKVNGVTVPNPANFYRIDTSSCLFFNFGVSNGGITTLYFPGGSARSEVTNWGSTQTGKMELFGSVDPSARIYVHPHFSVGGYSQYFRLRVDRINLD